MFAKAFGICIFPANIYLFKVNKKTLTKGVE